jgi:hypothetical protein
MGIYNDAFGLTVLTDGAREDLVDEKRDRTPDEYKDSLESDG